MYYMLMTVRYPPFPLKGLPMQPLQLLLPRGDLCAIRLKVATDKNLWNLYTAALDNKNLRTQPEYVFT